MKKCYYVIIIITTIIFIIIIIIIIITIIITYYMHTRVLMLGERPFHVPVDIDSMLLAVPIRSDTRPQILDVWLCNLQVHSQSLPFLLPLC